jgi:hypothetical protein
LSKPISPTRYFYRPPIDANRPLSNRPHSIGAHVHRGRHVRCRYYSAAYSHDPIRCLVLLCETRAHRETAEEWMAPAAGRSRTLPKKGTKKGPKLMIAFFWECTRTSFPLGMRSIHKISRGRKSLLHQIFKRASMWSEQRPRKSPALRIRRLSMVFARISRTVSPGQAPSPDGPRQVVRWRAELTAYTVSIIAPCQNIAHELAAALGDDSERAWPSVGKCGAQHSRDLLYLRGVGAGLTSSHMVRHFAGKRSTLARRAGSASPSRRTAPAAQSNRKLRASTPQGDELLPRIGVEAIRLTRKRRNSDASNRSAADHK